MGPISDLRVQEFGERFQKVVGLNDDQLLRMASELLGVQVPPALDALVLGFARRWRQDVLEPDLVMGPYDRNPSAMEWLEVGVLVRDQAGVPDFRLAVTGSDLRLLVAHAVLLFEKSVFEERCPRLLDEAFELGSGGRLRMLMRLREPQPVPAPAVAWRLLKVWGREETEIFTGIEAYTGSDPALMAAGILRGLANRTDYSLPEQRRFVEQYGAELLHAADDLTRRPVVASS